MSILTKFASKAVFLIATDKYLGLTNQFTFITHLSWSIANLFEPCHEKTCLRGFRPGT